MENHMRKFRFRKLQVRIELYRMIHMEAMEPNETISTIWSRIKDIREVSDVLVVNQSGELSCFYVNEEYPRRITGFIRLQTVRGADFSRYKGLYDRWIRRQLDDGR